MNLNLRERTHDAMRTELAQSAFDVMAQEGYDALTADDLARRIGISRATFFRYFGSKDEVAVAAMIEPDRVFAEALPPVGDGTLSLWQRLRAAVEPNIRALEAAPDKMHQRIMLIQSQPMLGARLRRARLPQVEHLAEALAIEGMPLLAAQTFAAAAIAVLDNCWSQWARAPESSLRQILDQAFAYLDQRPSA